jgi:glycosyltransferase involved in cell wall biosynthesis
MSFSIIIPSKSRENLLACVACIRAAKELSRIIIVDDFRDRDEARWLREEGPENVRAGVDGGCTWVNGITPFVFARNINRGIVAAGDDDVLLLNDDALLKTHLGFSWLASEANSKQEYGIMAAAVDGACGCVEQNAQPGTRVRPVKHHTIVFIAVYLRRAVLNGLLNISVLIDDGPFEPEGDIITKHWLDETFVSYGYDDDDMCERVRQLGLKLGVFDGCVVDHGTLKSSYRHDQAASVADLAPNRQRFEEKWGFAPGQGPSMRAKVNPAEPIRW